MPRWPAPCPRAPAQASARRSAVTERNHRFRLAAVGAALTVASAITVPIALSANAALPPPPSGWTQIWADDFNGPANSLPGGANWIFDLGHSYPGGPANWGTGEIQ